MPDERLFQLAKTGSLLEKDILRSEVDRMLDDPKCQSFIESFAQQWLGISDLGSVNPDQRLFPQFDEHLLESMRQGENGAFLAVDAALTEALLDEVTAVVAAAENQGKNPVLLCSDRLRPVIRRLLASTWPSLPVISFQELSPSLSLDPTGVIRVDNHQPAV